MGAFPDIVKMAQKAQDKANTATATKLTSQFRAHLVHYGVDQTDASKCSIAFDAETDEFVPKLTPEVEAHTLGTADAAPSGAVTSFFNKVDVNKIHSKELMAASRSVGLV